MAVTENKTSPSEKNRNFMFIDKIIVSFYCSAVGANYKSRMDFIKWNCQTDLDLISSTLKVIGPMVV